MENFIEWVFAYIIIFILVCSGYAMLKFIFDIANTNKKK